ncbi:hypothetical protein CC85DRAFT_328228 [Cutaneotrichosporon oleaginosum]|uniref:MFS general substrate transporter n=1 Tax=Cutaneotrichosporon oleaginosum TaxID=879819 RepID=A0A0J1B3U6_9TREE|nr:uncharacterized protein CC85DRAFT_328228 [Cutaneotrichosporon oleaginosum]KLT42324.1 hypothetical protein CC85DRAFT_328228 [Cutaneotrichosporon oleaginosum]TXT04144.1 hypothetical protein COLE_07841 [Cutaneotrichosporon oleaginosum]
MTPPHERTPLLAPRRSCFPQLYRVYLVSFVVGMTFSFTQTALIYSFRTMTCDEYYKTHEWDGLGDRCAIHAIESATARSVALMSSITTGCTLLNLFTSAWFISRFGVKAAMFQQTFWAALRNLTQIYAQTLGGRAGMLIITTTQLFNTLGSAGGFQLCANAFVAGLSPDAERTANFGVLGGVFMFGSGIGYTAGGVSERVWGYLAPFQGAFCLLVLSTLFGIFFLPHFTPEAKTEERRSFLAPLRVFVPRRRATGGRDWNLTLLGLGTFFSVLATGYVPMMLQLVATNVFGFTPDTSGYMLSLNLLVRGFFLTQCFPHMITAGRRWLSPTPTTTAKAPVDSPSPSSSSSSSSPSKTPSPGMLSSPTLPTPPSPASPTKLSRTSHSPGSKSRRPSLPNLPAPPIPNIPRRRSRSRRNSASPSASASPAASSFLAPAPEHPFDADGAELPDAAGAPVLDLAPPPSPGAPLFDLLFLRYSILLDGLLTGAVTLASAPWHMYAAAGVLPFASGTGPASKGVTLEFVPSHERAHALSAIALVEKLAQVTTIGVFGYAFSALSDAGLPTLVFAANGAVAWCGFALLLPVRLPRAAPGGGV